MHPYHTDKTLIKALRQHLPNAEVNGDNPKTGVSFLTWHARAALPLARVECQSVADVQTTLRIARDLGVPLSVSGGRLDPYARTNQDGYLVLDLRQMAGASHDATQQTVTVQGGATVGDLLWTLPEDTVTVTGANAGIGVTGLTLGGGYGMLNCRFGLACDVMRSAQVVLADGQVVDASRSGDAELFWALRGGGTGFGVVTSLTLETYRLPRLLSASLFFPLAAARPVLLLVQELLDEEPDQLSLLPLFATNRDGQRGLLLASLWNGDSSARGEQIVRRLAECEQAQVVQQGWVPYRETLDPPDLWPWGKRWAVDTRTLKRLDEPTVEILVEAAERMPSPTAMLFLHDFHGAPTRTAVGATAFPLRVNHFVAGIVSSWEQDQEQEAEANWVWVRETSARLANAAYPGGYVNFLSPEQDERVRLFYGAAADRLRHIKRRLDPENVFHASTGHFRTGKPESDES